jgi:hypothetical protein
MEPLERTDVYTLLRYTLELYIVSAWQHMGFLPDPATGQTHLALEEAQIAIDCADFLAGKLKPRLEPEEQREYERRTSRPEAELPREAERHAHGGIRWG